MADTTPQTLAAAAACYCFDRITAEKVTIYLLAQMAGLSAMTPAQLEDAAKCYCFDPVTEKKVVSYLLSQISTSGVGGSGLLRVTGTSPNFGLDGRLTVNDPWVTIIAPGP